MKLAYENWADNVSVINYTFRNNENGIQKKIDEAYIIYNIVDGGGSEKRAAIKWAMSNLLILYAKMRRGNRLTMRHVMKLKIITDKYMRGWAACVCFSENDDGKHMAKIKWWSSEQLSSSRNKRSQRRYWIRAWESLNVCSKGTIMKPSWPTAFCSMSIVMTIAVKGVKPISEILQ